MKQHIEDAQYSFGYRVKSTFGAYVIKSTDKDIVIPLDYASYAQLSVKNDRRHYSQIIYYDDAAFAKQNKELHLIASAPTALINNEFIVYYQLKHGIHDCDGWVGCEALVRWDSSQFGFVSPGEFIDLFEKNGFITKLDQYVFETTCRDLKQCIDDGSKVVPISINLSKRHFEEGSFLDGYEETLKKYDIPRELIEFEITETWAINNIEQVRDAIERIHKMGCKCSLDDFGKGFSSFDMVMNLRLDTIKLDASLFKDDVELNKSREIIIGSLIDLSHKLGMSVVAEGIETQQQVEFLASKGCDAAQGYFFAKPLPYSECRKMLNL